MANTTIALRQSGATGNTPSLGVLANGELSINYADGILYYKTASNTLGTIRTTQPAGLTKEVQFNDAGSFGTDSDFTYDKTNNRLNVENVIVNSAITIGSATGGTLTGANVIYSNTFVANSTTPSTSNTTGSIIAYGGVGVAGNVYAANVFTRGDIVAGLADGNTLGGATNPIIAAIGNTDYYIQSYTINYSNTANASADFVVYPNNGSDSNGWVDIGITSNAFSQAIYSVTGRNEGYLFMSAPGGSGTSGNLVIATDSTGTYNSIEFVVGGFNKGKSNSNVKITTATTSSSNVTGALQVTGGLGVKGNVNSDAVYIGGQVAATLGDVLAISIALG
jgi:hypothetical protein